MVEIFRAILPSPSVLILDEPTTGLDPESRAAIWEIIHALKRTEQLSILLTTHYLEEAMFSEQVAIMQKGKIKVSEKPEILKDLYASDSLYLYAQENHQMKKYLEMQGIAYGDQGSRIQIKVKNAEEAIELVKKLRGKFESFELIKGSLEDVFLTIINSDGVKACSAE